MNVLDSEQDLQIYVYIQSLQLAKQNWFGLNEKLDTLEAFLYPNQVEAMDFLLLENF